MSLLGMSDELAPVCTKKTKFLETMDSIVPWGEWIRLILPSYYKGERGITQRLGKVSVIDVI